MNCTGKVNPRRTLHLAAMLLVAGLPLLGQAPGAPPAAPERDGSMMPHRPPMEHAFHMGGPMGRWWDEPRMAKQIGITPDQQKKMDEIFQQNRLKLIDQHASVEKEEAILEPMISADQPDEAKVLSQIDKVAQSRAELEKANARMLLGLRRVLTAAQWQSLRSMDPRPGDRGGFGRRRGPDGGPPLDGGARDGTPNPPGEAGSMD